MIKKIFTAILLMAVVLPIMSSNNRNKTIRLKIVATTDVHGNFFPYNFITQQPWDGSMARVAAFVDSIRNAEGRESVLLLDNGDILQGQPTVYYYNYIDTAASHIADDIYRFLDYDAATIGNHDVETGHPVYDRWIAESPIPVLGANVIDTATDRPYLKPYTVICRGGLRIAVLGLLTPAIPAWLPQDIWSGLRFDDMTETAAKWIPIIKEKENPDLVIGLFHSGRDYSRKTADYIENASLHVAENVPGLDAVFFGHDHQRFAQKVNTPDGRQIWALNPANNARAVAVADISVSFDNRGLISDKHIEGSIVDIADITPSQSYLNRFESQKNAINEFVTRKIGVSTDSITTPPAFFGPSAFIQLLHDLQLEISGAEISLAAPLSFDSEIAKGDLTVSDMFKLYKYENMLYTMELTGREIKNYLEESYAFWTAQVDPDDSEAHLLLFASDSPSLSDNRLKNPSYNFDSAAGINYTVDITKPKGQKITITSLSSGKPFDFNRRYSVALNSYRGNGGGNHLTSGAGIPQSELASRIIRSTDKDLRYYLLKAIEKRGVVRPHIDRNWRFIPEDIAAKAAARDRMLLFGPGASNEQK